MKVGDLVLDRFLNDHGVVIRLHQSGVLFAGSKSDSIVEVLFRDKVRPKLCMLNSLEEVNK